MQSATCAPKLQRSLLVLLVVVLGACSPSSSEPAEPQSLSFAETLQSMAERISAVHQHKKGILELPFFRSTTVVEEINTMSYRIDVTTQNIVALNEYHQEAEKQGLSESDQFKFKAAELASLEKTLDHYDRVFAAFTAERDLNGELFFDLYGKTIHANQVLALFIEHEVPCSREQTLMRDYSTRVKDFRNYWCQELANIMRGLQPDAQIMALALGTAKGLAPDLSREHAHLSRAASDFHRLHRSQEGLKSRLDWSLETLSRLDETDAWRQATEPKVLAVADAMTVTEAATRAEMNRVLEDSEAVRDARDDLVAREAELLSELNQLVVVEAQKRGWPLPL